MQTRHLAVVGLLVATLASGCVDTPTQSAVPSTTPTQSETTPAVGSNGTGSPSANPSVSSPSASPSASDSSSPGPTDSLQAAFDQPENGGIGAFLGKHRDYLPSLVSIGDELMRGSSKGTIEIALKNVPSGTKRIYMVIACTGKDYYRMELTRADNSSAGAIWGDSCGYWGGLNGALSPEFDPNWPPTKLTITVDPNSRYSYALYASPGH